MTDTGQDKVKNPDDIMEISVVYLHEYRVVATKRSGERTILDAVKVTGLSPESRERAGGLANKSGRSALGYLESLGHPIEKTNFLETPAQIATVGTLPSVHPGDKDD